MECASQIACRVGRPPHRTLNIADFCGIAHDANLKASREQRVGEAPFPGGPLGADNIVHGDGPRRANRSGETDARSEEHTSELQSLLRISYAVFCLKKKTSHTSSL